MNNNTHTYATASTLTDRFGREHTYLRISVTDRCNLRCAYCMPAEDMAWKSRYELLTDDEIVRVATVAVGMGVRKIRVTGGEPLVRPGVEDLLERLAGIPGLRTLGITTNAVLLARKLPRIRPYVKAINVSLDTFRAARARALTGRDFLQDTLAGVDAALDAGYRNLKVNMVVMRGVNDDEIPDFVRLTAHRPISVRFIEFMPFAANNWSAHRCVTMDEIMHRLEGTFALEPLPEGRWPISRDFAVRDRLTGALHTGTVGVIASMSRPFCSTCSRLRLTAEGALMPCLHAPLEYDLRQVLRSDNGSDQDIRDTFQRALQAKLQQHLSGQEMAAQARRVMIQIGG